MNEADSEYIACLFRKRGFTLTDELKKADAVLINTCTVRQLAENKAISQIGRLRIWKKNHPDGKIFVVGCAAQRLGEKQIKNKFPFVDEVCGAKDINLIENYINRHYPETSDEYEVHNKNIYRSPLTSYVTIMRGCSHKCSYCIVPYVRGNAISLPPEQIMKEASQRLNDGAKELVLLGQTVNAYNCQGTDFTSLLKQILSLPKLERLRFMSPHPIYFNDSFFDLLKEEPKLARHIHLPAQSGSDRILKQMRRGYTHKQYLDLIKRLHDEIPDIAVSTDFIVGYPGETREDFEQTLQLTREAKFSLAYCFIYSPRTDKPEMAADIPKEETDYRVNTLLKCVKDNSHLVLSDRIGKIEEVLFETANYGKTSSNMAVRINTEVSPGSMEKVEITAAEKNTLNGKVLYGKEK